VAITWRTVALSVLGVAWVVLWPLPLTVLIWALVVVVLVLVDVLAAASPRMVKVTRDVPGSVRLGESTSATLTLENLGKRRLRALVRDAWPPSAIADDRPPGSALPRRGVRTPRLPMQARPGEGARGRTPLLPSRRGDLVVPFVAVRTFGPLGLAGRQARIPLRGRLRVLPAFVSRRHLPSRLSRLRELDGRTSVLVRSSGTEFDSLREYVIGDDVRSIDWRATARRNDVVVRTWRPERDRRVMIVVDTGRTSATRVLDGTRLEASIETALLLGVLADRAGDRVEVVAFDRQVRARVAGASRSELLATMADALAPVEPTLVETDWTGVAAQVRARMSQRALVVLLTNVDPSAVEGGLLDVTAQLAKQHQVLVASVADPTLEALRSARGNVVDAYDAAAAERTILGHAQVAMRLRRRGVEVVDALPDDLPPAVADAYLALKAAGKL
jgi:uncharacterized protein (DUF58 family)